MNQIKKDFNFFNEDNKRNFYLFKTRRLKFYFYISQFKLKIKKWQFFLLKTKNILIK